VSPRVQPPRRRGPQKAPTKQLLTVRFDPSVVDYYRATGAGWQTRMNDDLLRLVARRSKGAR
jgi:uncharacterized protein (DUF4415 family)